MRTKEENVNSLCIVVEKEISLTWLSRFPSPPGLIRMFKTRDDKLANTIRLEVGSIPNSNRRESLEKKKKKKNSGVKRLGALGELVMYAVRRWAFS